MAKIRSNATEGVLGNPFPVLLGAVALATEGKQQTCAKRNATEGVLGNPFPDKTSNAPEVRIDLASRCWVRATSCHEVTEGKQ